MSGPVALVLYYVQMNLIYQCPSLMIDICTGDDDDADDSFCVDVPSTKPLYLIAQIPSAASTPDQYLRFETSLK